MSSKLVLRTREVTPGLLMALHEALNRAKCGTFEGGEVTFRQGHTTGRTWRASGSADVMVDLIEDTGIPALWTVIHADSDRLRSDLEQALQEATEVESIDALREAARATPPPRGALQRLGLVLEDKAGLEDVALFEQALRSKAPHQRADGVIGATFSGNPALIGPLEAALANEKDPGIADAIRYAIGRIRREA